MNLPARPSCHGQCGRIVCDCGNRGQRDGKECAAAKYLWDGAQNIADMTTSFDRNLAVMMVRRFKGRDVADAVVAAAKILIDEQARVAA